MGSFVTAMGPPNNSEAFITILLTNQEEVKKVERMFP